jgi:hypothetical protein
MRTDCALALLLCLLLPAWPAHGADAVADAADAGGATAQAQFAPTPADASAAELLSTARYALAQLELELSAQDRRIYSSQAITALTGLYQLHGCTWARTPLSALYHSPGCTDLHVGYSADGRLMLRVESMKLQNPAFAPYVIYLCTFVSCTPLDLRANRAGMLRITLADGTALEAESITSAHPLWPNLARLAPTFRPVDEVPTGGGKVFKQVFALNPGLSVAGSPSGSISAVSLVWDGYTIEVPYYENEVQLERPSAK